MQSFTATFREAKVPEDPEKRKKIQYTIPGLTDPIANRNKALAAALSIGFPIEADFISSSGKIQTFVYYEDLDFFRKLWGHFLSDPQGDVDIKSA
jgi:hypothetical protein